MTNQHTRAGSGLARGRLARWALVLALMTPLAGCDILDVNNPNNLTQDDVVNVDASDAITEGAQSAVSGGIAEMAGPYSTVTDELIWIGSRDAWEQLNVGSVEDPANEFVDRAFPFLAEGRWMADEAIAINRDHVSESNTADLRENLAESLMWGGVIYTAIGDMMEDFAFSDRMEAGAPVGAGNMGSVYQTAIDYLTESISMAQADGLEELELQATAMRARAAHAQAVWNCLHGGGGTCPLVAAGTADAQAVVDDEGFSDWQFRLQFSPATITDVWQSVQFQVNERGELQIGPTYVTLNADESIADTIFVDPLTGDTDPRVASAMAEFLGGGQFSPITQASNREMYLILAEAELATNGNTATFQGLINNVRQDLSGPSPGVAYTGPGTGLTGEEILEHERQANLFMQNRRLADHYRFDNPPPEWVSTSFAFNNPGAMLPITCIEVRANPNINTPGC